MNGALWRAGNPFGRLNGRLTRWRGVALREVKLNHAQSLPPLRASGWFWMIGQLDYDFPKGEINAKALDADQQKGLLENAAKAFFVR